jgi:hypothetical protein
LRSRIAEALRTLITLKGASAVSKVSAGSADAQIDALMYELYGLTEKEIAIVEGL